MYAGQPYLREEVAQTFERMGLDASTVNAGFEHARTLSRHSGIWDRILQFPNSDTAAEADGRTTDSLESSLSNGTTARSSPSMPDGSVAVSAPSQRDTVSFAAASAPSLLPCRLPTTPILENLVATPAPRRGREDYDRVPPGDSFSDPKNDQVPEASREAVALNETRAHVAGNGIQSPAWGDAVASHEITGEDLQFQESRESLSSNEITPQKAGEGAQSAEERDGIQSQEAVHGIQSGAKAAPSANILATKKCCFIL